MKINREFDYIQCKLPNNKIVEISSDLNVSPYNEKTTVQETLLKCTSDVEKGDTEAMIYLVSCYYAIDDDYTYFLRKYAHYRDIISCSRK